MAMRRWFWIAGGVSLALAIVAACVPDYGYQGGATGGDSGTDAAVDSPTTVTEGGTDGGTEGGGPPPGMVLIEGGTIPYTSDDAGVLNATLTYDFYIDIHEATVTRLRAWVDAGMPVPKDGQDLDPNGIYSGVMTWNGDDANTAATKGFDRGGFCDSGRYFNGDGGSTYLMGDDDFPANCVNWAQAAAICFFEGKRLPTEIEWYMVASNRGTTDYPWGNQAPDCTRSSFQGCTYPRKVGATVNGASQTGVFDLAGSTRENVWDRGMPNQFPRPIPDNYAGMAAGTAFERAVRGGWYWSGNVRANDRGLFSVGSTWDGHGFRCAKAVKK
jgi:formylglycine-generating enzyme required for sulfatase activity